MTKEERGSIIVLESSEHANASNYNLWEKSHIFFIPVLENSEQVNKKIFRK